MKIFLRSITIIFFLGPLLTAAGPCWAQPIIRKTSLVQGKDYYQHTFYKGGREIASQKENTSGTYDQKGFLPDGEVQFVDKAHKTYGEENYRYGLKNGLAKTYFSDGALRKEEFYEADILVWEKEYYRSGTLRLSADYRDALDCGKKNEVGQGKIYFDDGGLKYEWLFKVQSQRNYKKAYIRSGPLRYEAYFNDKCELVEERQVADPEAAVVTPSPAAEVSE